jgi:hypothetical protein
MRKKFLINLHPNHEGGRDINFKQEDFSHNSEDFQGSHNNEEHKGNYDKKEEYYPKYEDGDEAQISQKLEHLSLKFYGNLDNLLSNRSTGPSGSSPV